MKALKSLALALTLVLFGSAAQAQLKITETDNAKLFMTLNTVGTAQTLNHKNAYDLKGVELAKVSPGFQNAFGNLGFIAKYGKNDEITVVFDMYLSSRNHPSQTYGNEGYILMTGVPENLENLKFLTPIFNKVDVKAGHMLVDFGDAAEHRSNNAITQKNPLVGNFVIDPNIVSIGMQVSSKPGKRYGWLAGVSNGTTTEDWNVGRGFAYNGKVYFVPVTGLRTSLSYIATDQSDNPNKSGGGSQMQMFTGNRSGERYAGVLGGGQAPGNVFPQAGEKFSAAQFDVTYDTGSPLKLYGHYGYTQDLDINGSAAGTPEEKWAYYAADARYNFTPTLYGAVRYSGAQANKLAGADSNGTVSRIQVGGGFWLSKNLLLKVEYVQQQYDGFGQGQVVNNNIQAWKNPEFSGVISEVSFSF
jgi:hypothetical protein